MARDSAPDSALLAAIRESALDRAPVSLGPRRTVSVHEFYRYPARFSPALAASIIEAFSEVRDVVLDPFVGGGTTAVEARLQSRYAVASDINSLAVFVTRAKTRTYTSVQLTDTARWFDAMKSRRGMQNAGAAGEPMEHQLRNFSGAGLDEHRALIIGSLRALGELGDPRARDFARCVMLRAAQWAFDMRDEVPTLEEFQETAASLARDMVDVAGTTSTAYRAADRIAGRSGRPRVLTLEQGLPGLAARRALGDGPAPRLVLTSPPYPGVYVNYHRWKVRGRKETPLPYYITGQLDGHGLAYYTMAARARKTLDSYFARLQAAFADIAALSSEDTWLVQVVGFNDVQEQFPRYLEVMRRAGFREVTFPELSTDEDGRLWRDVPGRRWWARAGQRSDVTHQTAREVVLVHRLES